MSFLAVVREGLETALLLYAAARGATASTGPVIGDPGSWYAALLGGLVNFTPAPTVLETAAWLGYGIPVLILFVWPARPGTKPGGTRPSTTTPPDQTLPSAAANA